MKTVQFFWNYFKVYKLSFVVVILMIVLATLAQDLFPVFSGQAVTQLANLVQAYQNGNPELVWQSLSGIMVNLGPVSYTHLRAHETDQYLVCRLLLEKKKQI